MFWNFSIEPLYVCQAFWKVLSTMVGKVFIHFPLYIPGLTLWFDLILNSSHKILCDSSIMIKKALIYTMNALNKSSELWHTSVNRKARPVVEEEHNKSWNDHDFSFVSIIFTKFQNYICTTFHIATIHFFFFLTQWNTQFNVYCIGTSFCIYSNFYYLLPSFSTFHFWMPKQRGARTWSKKGK